MSYIDQELTEMENGISISTAVHFIRKLSFRKRKQKEHKILQMVQSFQTE
jgi:hypothetical protein